MTSMRKNVVYRKEHWASVLEELYSASIWMRLSSVNSCACNSEAQISGTDFMRASWALTALYWKENRLGILKRISTSEKSKYIVFSLISFLILEK